MRRVIWLLAGILVISFILHLLLIGKVPPGVTNDEAVDGYDAYSILKTGRDQWGKSLPLEFRSFGDYKLPLFIYSLAPSIYFFGLNVFSLRFTATIFAVLLVWGLFIIGKELFNETVGLIASFLLAISPWFFALSRFAHEGPLHTFFVLLGVYFSTKALKQGKYYLISFVFFVMSFYTYHTARLFVPLLLSVLFFIFRKKVTQQRKWLLVSFILSTILCFPIFKSMLTGTAKSRLAQTNITRDVGTLNVLNQKLGVCVEKAPFILCKIIYNKPVFFIEKFATNYLNHFSFSFLFLKGKAEGMMGDSSFLYFSILPIFLLGLFYLFKEKERQLPALILIIWLLLAPIADSLTSEGHYSRTFLMIVPICLISSWGVFKIWRNSKNLVAKKLFIFRHKRIPEPGLLGNERRSGEAGVYGGKEETPSFCAGGGFILVLSVFLLFEVVSFFSDYFFYFPKYYSIYTHYEYQPLFEYLTKIEKDYSQIYISRRYNDTKQYVFYLFYTSFNPQKYQEKKDIEWQIEEDGWIWVGRIGRWHFVASIPDMETIPDNSLLIGSPKEEINKLITTGRQEDKPLVTHLKTINYLNGDPAFSVVAVRRSTTPEVEAKKIKN